MALRRGEDRLLDVGLARADEGEPCAGCDEMVKALGEDVEALLPGEAAHHSVQQAFTVSSPKRCSTARLFGEALGQGLHGVGLRDEPVIRRVPDRVVDAVDDAAQHSRLARSKPSRPMP